MLLLVKLKKLMGRLVILGMFVMESERAVRALAGNFLKVKITYRGECSKEARRSPKPLGWVRFPTVPARCMLPHCGAVEG